MMFMGEYSHTIDTKGRLNYSRKITRTIRRNLYYVQELR